MTKQEWFKNIYRYAAPAARRYNIPISILMAQAAIESGYGGSSLYQKYNNVSGMKVGSGRGYWTGTSVNMNTGEYIKGQYTTVPANFRVYKNLKESFMDLAHRHRERAGIDFTGLTPGEGITKIVNSGYATAPNYGSVLANTINQYSLLQYDKKLKTDTTLRNLGIVLGLTITGYGIYKAISQHV